MKYFLIAGEPSGDQHASRLMQALAEKDPKANFRFLGGDRMAEIGGKPVVHIREMAFMGFSQVLTNLGQIRRNFKRAKKAIYNFDPDVIILVDYPGFNLRMAKWSRKKGYNTYYYIAPAVWAWNTRRVYSLKKSCDRIFSILPFEPEFFRKYGMEVDYVGNPVFEEIQSVQKSLAGNDRGQKKQIALLPGSRKQEIERILPEMLSVISYFDEYEFVLAAMDSHRDLYEKLIPETCRIRLEFNRPLEVLNNSDAALVTSGTATLETALMSVPQVICYKANAISYQIARRLIKVPYISLVNLILEGPAIPELIQGNCRTDKLLACLKSILPGGENHENQLLLARSIQEKLGVQKASINLSGLITRSLEPIDRQEKIF